jgi:serine acetyltransferase
MKTRPIEILIISLLLLLITAMAFAGVYLLTPLTKSCLSEYHVIAELFIFMGAYILISALTVKILIIISPLEVEQYGVANFSMTSDKALYWKVLTSITVMGGMYFLPMIPLLMRPLFYKLFGAHIGKDVEIAGTLAELPWITIEEFAFIGGDTFITAHAVTHNLIILKPVKISKRAVIGVGAIILPGVEVGEGSIVAPGSVVPMDTIIPPYEFWSGVPAKKERSIKFLQKTALKS